MYIPLGTPFKALFQESPIPSQQKLFQRTESLSHYFYYESGNYPKDLKQKIRENKAVAVATKDGAVLRFQDSENPFRVSGGALIHFNAGFVVQKNCPWTEVVNQAIMQMIESGIVAHLRSKYMPPSKPLGDSESNLGATKPEPFKIEHITFGIFLLAIGSALGLTAFLVEILKGKKILC